MKLHFMQDHCSIKRLFWKDQHLIESIFMSDLSLVKEKIFSFNANKEKLRL